RSNTRQANTDRWLKALSERGGLQWEDVAPMTRVRAEYLQTAFANVDKTYGSFDEYVSSALKLSNATVEARREPLLDRLRPWGKHLLQAVQAAAEVSLAGSRAECLVQWGEHRGARYAPVQQATGGGPQVGGPPVPKTYRQPFEAVEFAFSRGIAPCDR